MIIADGMLTISVLGMCAYGAYSAGWALLDLARGARLELWAELGLILFGALLGLQALAVHDAVHLGSGPETQIARAVIAVVLVLLAWAGGLSAART